MMGKFGAENDLPISMANNLASKTVEESHTKSITIITSSTSWVGLGDRMDDIVMLEVGYFLKVEVIRCVHGMCICYFSHCHDKCLIEITKRENSLSSWSKGI